MAGSQPPTYVTSADSIYHSLLIHADTMACGNVELFFLAPNTPPLTHTHTHIHRPPNLLHGREPEKEGIHHGDPLKRLKGKYMAPNLSLCYCTNTHTHKLG